VLLVSLPCASLLSCWSCLLEPTLSHRQPQLTGAQASSKHTETSDHERRECAQDVQKVALLLQTFAAPAVSNMRAGTFTPANLTAATSPAALTAYLAQNGLPSIPP